MERIDVTAVVEDALTVEDHFHKAISKPSFKRSSGVHRLVCICVVVALSSILPVPVGELPAVQMGDHKVRHVRRR